MVNENKNSESEDNKPNEKGINPISKAASSILGKINLRASFAKAAQLTQNAVSTISASKPVSITREKLANLKPQNKNAADTSVAPKNDDAEDAASTPLKISLGKEIGSDDSEKLNASRFNSTEEHLNHIDEKLEQLDSLARATDKRLREFLEQQAKDKKISADKAFLTILGLLEADERTKKAMNWLNTLTVTSLSQENAVLEDDKRIMTISKSEISVSHKAGTERNADYYRQIALVAAGNPDMRKNGIEVEGDNFSAYMMHMAAKEEGLKVVGSKAFMKKLDPQLKNIYDAVWTGQISRSEGEKLEKELLDSKANQLAAAAENTEKQQQADLPDNKEVEQNATTQTTSAFAEAASVNGVIQDYNNPDLSRAGRRNLIPNINAKPPII
jgi:hypothetical protein